MGVDAHVKEYGISHLKYQELMYFCRQFHEKIVSAAAEDQPEKRDALIRDCAMIEESAKKAAPQFWHELLRNVVRKIPYEQLNVPCGRRQFYSIRRKFFVILSQMRERK